MYGNVHEWRQGRSFGRTEFEELRQAVKRIVGHCASDPAMRRKAWLGRLDAPPFVTKRRIGFDRKALGQRGGVVLERTLDPRKGGAIATGWEWCTSKSGPSQTPEAILAAAVLAYVESIHGIPVTGTAWTGREWLKAVETARAALPERASELDVPRVAQEQDRWCPPFLHQATPEYRLAFCVDGRAYATRVADGETLAFHDHASAARWTAQDREGTWTQRPAFHWHATRAAEDAQRLRFEQLFAGGWPGCTKRDPPGIGEAWRYDCRRTFTDTLEDFARRDARFRDASFPEPVAGTLELTASGS